MSAAFAPLRAAPPPSTAFRPVFGAAPADPPCASDPVVPDDDGAAQRALMEDARAAGYAAGLEAGRRATEALGQERIALALEMMAAALDQAGQAADRAARDTACELASLVLAMLEAALPDLAAQRAPETLKALVASLLPQLKLLRAPRLFVAPGLAEALGPVLQGLAVSIAADAALAESDARIEWEAGVLRFDRAARMAALREALAQAGIGLEG